MIFVKPLHSTVEADIDVLPADRGHSWKARIIDCRSREVLEIIGHKGPVFQTAKDAAHDADRCATDRLRAIQTQRDAARRA